MNALKSLRMEIFSVRFAKKAKSDTPKKIRLCQYILYANIAGVSEVNSELVFFLHIFTITKLIEPCVDFSHSVFFALLGKLEIKEAMSFSILRNSV